MLPENIRSALEEKIVGCEHPRELVIDVMLVLQRHFGFLNDEAVETAAELLGMSLTQIEELATFYTFIYREPVGKYVIHVCDSIICWMDGYESIRQFLCMKLGIQMGESTADGLFTLLPVCCIGYCDQSPAMLINGKAYGCLTAQKIDALVEKFRTQSP
jgi:NADH-quinone oxidoreductase subunit E